MKGVIFDRIMPAVALLVVALVAGWVFNPTFKMDFGCWIWP